MLITTPNMAKPDEFYARLLAIHDELTEQQGAQFNARLILLFANQIGDQTILEAALEAARSNEG